MVDVLALIFPKEKKFYGMIEDQMENIAVAVDDFCDLVLNFSKLTEKKRALLVSNIQKKEREGDKIYEKTVEALKATFITPMDREDIHRLVGRMDDIVDQLEVRSVKIKSFKVKKMPKNFIKLCSLFKGQFKDLEECILGLGRKRDIEKYVSNVHEAEREADSVFIEGIAELFDKEHDPIEIIKLKDLYESMEKTIDLTYSVVQVIENLTVKYA